MSTLDWSFQDSPWIIPCLDIYNGLAATLATCPQGNSSNDPAATIRLYTDDGADKIFLDILETWDDQEKILRVVSKLSQQTKSLLVSVAHGQAPHDANVNALLDAGAGPSP